MTSITANDNYPKDQFWQRKYWDSEEELEKGMEYTAHFILTSEDPKGFYKGFPKNWGVKEVK